MGEMTSMADIIRHMALADPQRAFEASIDTFNLERSNPRYEPTMLDHDGDEVHAQSVHSTLVDGGPIVIAEYPGITTASVGSEQMTIVRRQWRGKEALVSHYVFDQRLERFRATGLFGEIEGMDEFEFLQLLREQRILDGFSLSPKGIGDSDYVAFLHEHGASGNVIAD